MGAESSSHIFLAYEYYFDDAILATLKLAEFIGSNNTSLSDIMDQIKKYEYKSFNRPFKDSIKFNIIDKIKEHYENQDVEILDIDGVRVSDKCGWILVRASNTEPIIRITVEAKNEKIFEKKKNEIFEMLNKYSE